MENIPFHLRNGNKFWNTVSVEELIFSDLHISTML